jgi:three-Cys-motif partner protein
MDKGGSMGAPVDEIGPWSEVKLEIIGAYAAAYSTVLAAQKSRVPLKHVFIDGFAGAGWHRSRTTGELVEGSPARALNVVPPFVEYFFVDKDPAKVDALRQLAVGRDNVRVLLGDCNAILPASVFPQIAYKSYRRALCLLDPYGLHLRWEVVAAAARMRTIEILLNFPIMDMNQNALFRDQGRVEPSQAARMTAYWGDETWRDIAYSGEGDLFGHPEKLGNEAVVAAFQKRLKDVAGFAFVPEPIAMRNRTNAVVYYLFFATHNRTGARIVEAVFKKHR